MKKRFGIIVNPAAGNGNSLRDIPKLKKLFNNYPINYDFFITEEPQHATEITESIRNHYDAIIVFGGDGTINEVVNGLIGSEIPLGVIPHGRGNDFVRSINVVANYRHAIHTLMQYKVKKIDLGLINDIHFINGIGVGLDGFINEESQKPKKGGILSSRLAYIWSLLKAWLKWQAIPIRIEVDDQLVMEEHAYLVAIGNGRACGGGVLLNPMAVLDDGKLNINFVADIPKTKLIYKFNTLLNGKIGTIREVNQFLGEKIRLNSEHRLPVHYHGEVYTNSENEIDI
ncbi:MAG: diacylglycerol kinase family lipid kinase, partial [Candidatus Marinimicrobia bacterium]|nr:diacylglycerol kinase family lipid kinase [Candidatus Neomarinimicrobiota bacterium]